MLRSYVVLNNLNKGNAVFDTHLHDEFEINFMLTDGVKVIIEDKMFISKIGDIFIFPPYTFHSIDSEDKPFSRYLMFFNENETISACSALKPAISMLKASEFLVVTPNEKGVEELMTMFDIAYKENDSDCVFSDYNKIKAIGSILEFIISLLKKANYSKPALDRENEVLDILNYINNNYYDSELTVDSIAKHFGMSDVTLWNLMKKSVLLSPKEYILKIRIARASELLTNGVSVTETAEKTGFNSYAHFIRIFKKYTGTTPYKYGK